MNPRNGRVHGGRPPEEPMDVKVDGHRMNDEVCLKISSKLLDLAVAVRSAEKRGR